MRFVLRPTLVSHFDVDYFRFAMLCKHDICCFCPTITWGTKISHPPITGLQRAPGVPVGFVRVADPDRSSFLLCSGTKSTFGENLYVITALGVTQNRPPLTRKPTADHICRSNALPGLIFTCVRWTPRLDVLQSKVRAVWAQKIKKSKKCEYWPKSGVWF